MNSKLYMDVLQTSLEAKREVLKNYISNKDLLYVFGDAIEKEAARTHEFIYNCVANIAEIKIEISNLRTKPAQESSASENLNAEKMHGNNTGTI